MKKIIGVLSIMMLIASCTEKSKVMKIGIITPLTGEGASYGDAMKKGFDLAFKGDNNYNLSMRTANWMLKKE